MNTAGPWVRRLCVAVMALSVAEFLIATTGVQIQRLPDSTDFATYWLAGTLAREGRSPYDRAVLAARGRAELGLSYDQFPFLYPPPFALAMQPLSSLPYPRARALWMLISTAALLGGLAVTLQVVRTFAARVGLGGHDLVWIVGAALFASALNSTSVHNDIRAGSVGCVLFLCAATVAWATLPAAALPTAGAGHRRGAGRDAVLAAALVVATIAKLVPLVWIAWVAWRGRRRAAFWAIAGLALVSLPALARWGWEIVPTYGRDALVPSLRDDVSPPMNQSLQAAISRLLVASRWVTPPVDMPDVARVLSALGVVAITIGTVAGLRWARRNAIATPIEFGFVVLAMLLVMKLTWVQTMVAMLFVWPVLTIVLGAAVESEPAWVRRTAIVAAAGYFLSSAHVPILWAGLQHGPAVAVTTAHALGLLLLWGACATVLRHGAAGRRAAALQGCAATTARG